MSPTNLIMQIIDFIFDNLFILIIFASFILPLFRPNKKKAVKPALKPVTGLPKQSTTQPVVVEADDDFAKRLAEARKRVQSAMGETEASTTQTVATPATLTTPKAAQKPLASRQPLPKQQAPTLSSQTSSSILGKTERSAHPLFTADQQSSFLPSESVTSSAAFMAEQAPLQVEKRKVRKQAKVEKLLKFDEQSVARGFVWHYILSEPKSKEGRNHSRRKAFQHQS